MSPDKIVYSFPKLDTHVDRYLKWLPAALTIGGNNLGLTMSHPLGIRLLRVTATVGLVKISTRALKHTVRRSRPGLPLDGRSFPSSHSSIAFAGAALLRSELLPRYRAASWAGYVPALLTALLRISKRRHWPSDVVAGAVVGTMSTWIVHRIFTIALHKRKHKPDVYIG